MSEPISTPALGNSPCQVECLIDATPEKIIEAWCDPVLFDRLLSADPDALVIMRRRPGETAPSSIYFERADGSVQERCGLRVAYETTPDLAMMIGHGESGDDDGPLCLTLTVATEPGLAGQGQQVTPFVLTLATPGECFLNEAAQALVALAKTLVERVKARAKRNHDEQMQRFMANREAQLEETRAVILARTAIRAAIKETIPYCGYCVGARYYREFYCDLSVPEPCRYCSERLAVGIDAF